MNPEFEILYRRNFASFVDFAFRELHPGKEMEGNWHIELLTDFLEFAWMTKDPGLDRKQIINMPPKSLKTHICSICFPVWVMMKDPRKSVLIISETADHAFEIRERCAELISSKRFRSLFPYVRIAQNKRRLELTQGGEILHAGAGHSFPSRRSDLVVIDNPQSLHSIGRSDLSSFVEIERTLKNPQEGLIVMATRRLGKGDLSDILRQMSSWMNIGFPAIAMQEYTINFPPNVSYQWVKGVRMQEGLDDWQTFERDVCAIDGENFGWQYMQGMYQPQNQGERLSRVDEHGMQWVLVGKFDATAVALEDVRRCRAAFLDVDYHENWPGS